MNLPLISRIKATRPLRSGDTPVPSPCWRQECLRSLPIAFLALSLLFPAAHAAPFTPGNLVICRVGDGSTGLVNTGNPVFLDEVSPTGSLVQSIALPAVNESGGSNRSLILTGNATSEGQLTRSLDKRYLALAGYNTTIPYASSLSATTAPTVFRTVGLVNWNGGIDTSKVLQDFASGSSPRAALTADGTAFWAVGGAGGVRYTTLGSGTTSDHVSSGIPTLTNLRAVNAFGGQLFVSTASGTAVRIGSVGTGLPTTTGQSITNLPGIPTTGGPNGFLFADLDSSVAGADTLYVADDVGGLQKFSLVTGTWTSNGAVGTDADDYRGLTAIVNGSSVTLFALRKAQGALGGGEMVKVTDASGFNAAITATPELLATAAANTAFRGVAPAPYSRSDLTVELAAPTTAQAGSSFTYTLTARNTGNVAASGISLGFVSPAGLSVGTINGASGFSGFASGNIVNFTGGSLAAGASATLTINVSSATAGTFTTAAQAAFIDPSNTIVEVDETNNGSSQIVSTVVSLPVTPPAITTQPASQTIASGATATLSVVATGSPAPTFQWYRGNSGDTSNPVSGATSSSFTTPALTTTTSYWVQASNASGIPANSQTATVTVTPAVLDWQVVVTGPASVVHGDQFEYVVTVTNAGNVPLPPTDLIIADDTNMLGVAAEDLEWLSYQFDGGDNIVFTFPEQGITAGYFETVALQPGASDILRLRMRVPNLASGIARLAALVNFSYGFEDSNPANDTSAIQTAVTDAPSITTHPASQTIATGATATLTVVATGSPAPSFQWYRGNSGDTSTPVGTNSATFTTPALTSSTSYWVRVTNAVGTVDSNTAFVSVASHPGLVLYDAFQLDGGADGDTIAGKQTSSLGMTGSWGVINNVGGTATWRAAGLGFGPNFPTSGGALQMQTTASSHHVNAWRELDLASISLGGTIWGGFLFSTTNGGSDGRFVSGVGVETGLTSTAVTVPHRVGDNDEPFRFNVQPDNNNLTNIPGTNGMKVRQFGDNSYSGTSGSAPVTGGQTHLMVFKIENAWDGTAAQANQTYRFWILDQADYDAIFPNFTEAALDAHHVSSGGKTDGLRGSLLDGHFLNLFGLAAGAAESYSTTFDEIRIGSNLPVIMQNPLSAIATWTGASGNSWALAGNWNPNSIPGAAASIVFNGSSTSNLSTALDQDFDVQGITIAAPAGPVSIGGADYLTLRHGGIDLTGASQYLTINAPLLIASPQTWNVAGGRTLGISEPLSAVSDIVVTGAGRILLGAPNVLPSGAGSGDLVVNSTLDLNGFPQSMNGLTGGGIIDNAAGGAITLTLGANDALGFFNGTIQNTSGTLALVKVGSADLSLLGTNTFSGGFTNHGTGIIRPRNNAAFGTGPVVMNGGTLFAGPANYTFANPLTLNGALLRVGGGNLRTLTWNGPVTATGNSAMSADGGTSGVTINGPLDISGATFTATASSNINTINGSISGAGGNLIVQNNLTGTLQLAGNNTYGGTTTISGGTLRLAATGTLPPSGNLVINAGLTIRNTVGWTHTGIITGSGAGAINLNTGTNATLAGAISGLASINVNNAGTNATISGAISGATNVTVQNTVDGNGVGAILRLAGANTYTGNTTLQRGTLVMAASNVLPDTTVVSIGNATLDTASFADSAGTLDVTSTATIRLGSGAALAFANSSAVDWTGGTLTITGPFVSGSSLRFGTNANGLTSGQLALISANGFTNFLLNENGFLTAAGGAPSSVHHFVISAISTPQVVGVPITGITITAQDASNATATDFNGSVVFGGSGGFGGNSANFVAGVLTGASVMPSIAGSNLTLTVGDGSGHTGSTTIAVIQPDPSVAPSITTQPASQNIISGTSATFSVVASGFPAPTFQWYLGLTGDTSAPIPDATASSYITPPVTGTASYWVRASNRLGFADSDTATVQPLSTNSNLSSLAISAGTLSRATGKGFSSSTTSYTVYLSNATTELSVTPTAVEPDATVTVNGTAVLSGATSAPMTLAVGANTAITIVVTAPDGLTTTTYNVSPIRSAPALTSPAIAFTGYNADGVDDIAFVALTNIPQDSVFHFSDNEWNGQPLGAGGAFVDSNECEFVWIAPAGGIAAGTVVALGNLSNPTISATAGTAAFSEASGRGFSATSESLHAFQGSTEAPEVFHAAISTDPALQLAGTNLVVGASAIALSTASDGGVYAAGRNDRVAFADYLPPVNSVANWSDIGNGDGNTLLPFSLTPFTLGTTNATLSINNVSVLEGNSGATSLSFTVTRSNNGGTFTVLYATTDGDAVVGSDYEAASGELEFTAGGPSSLPVVVTVNGDTDFELDETFEVNLSNVVSSLGVTAIFDGKGIGEILDDDKTAPAIVTQPADSAILLGATAVLTVEVSGAPAPSLQWYRGNSGDTSIPIPGATGLTFTTPALTATSGFWVRATNPSGSADSTVAIVTVLPSPEILVEEPAGTPLATGAIRAFGSGLVGTTSAVKTIVIHNTGDAPLQNLQVTLGGSHPEDFPVDLQELAGYASTLPAGLQVDVPVLFRPTTAGVRSATLTIASNDVDENAIVVSLSGTGVFPSVIDGHRASNEGYTSLAVQTLPTSAGTGDVLANLSAKQDVSRLNLFLGGRASAGNSILLFIDSKPGGVSFISNDLITSGGEAEYINNLGTSPTSGLTFESGFNPDFAIRIYGTGTDAFVNRYDLQSRNRVYAGNSGAGNQTSGFISDMRTDWRDPVGASGSIEYGVEMALNIPSLGMTPGTSSLRMMAVLVNDNSTTAYNQVLAPLTIDTDIGSSINSIDFQAVQGIQTVSFEVDNSDVDGDGDPDATDADDDNDGLLDIHETGTGLFSSATNTGTNSKDPDTDGDGVNDGAEASGSGLGFVSNPNIPNYASMAVPGDFTTPPWKEDGSAGNAMTRVGTSLATQFQWTLDYHFVTPATPILFKFAANGTWNVNWGGSGSPGVAQLAGTDLTGLIQDSGIYRFSFGQGANPPTYSLVRMSFPDLASYLTAYGLTGLGGIDSDNDGLTNAQEFQINSDPRNADSDGDGTNDFLPVPPVITSQPLASQSIANGASASLSVAASGLPAPTFQWYRGTSGNTASPVSGATLADFTTPSLTVTTGYWVRASNSAGQADSTTATVNVALSPNANLSALALSQGALSPGFAAGTVAYSVSVPGEVAQVSVTPMTAHPNATVQVRVNGGTYSGVVAGTASAGLGLNVGANTVEVRVTAQDGTTKLYTLTVTRERAPDLAVGLTAPATVNMGADFDYVLTLSNISPVAYPGNWALRLVLPAGVELVGFPASNPVTAPASVFGDTVYFSGTGFAANQFQTFKVTAKCTLPGIYRVPAGFAGLFVSSSYEEDYANNSHAADVNTEALPVYSAPVIVTQVVSNQVITSGNTANLTFAASGYPAPTYQWYRGPSGDFSNPVNGATLAAFTTPALSVTTSYWARASNSEGAVDSVTATIEVVPPSSNTYLAGLSLSQGILIPGFSPFVTEYAVSVPHAATSFRITPVTEDPAASAKVNGTPVASGATSGQVPLQVGANTVIILVTAEDDTATKAYTLTVTRSQPLVLATQAADAVTATSALLRGSVTPFDPAVVYFQYGTTTAYGSSTPGQDVTGSSPVPIQANLTGIAGNTLYHFRIVAVNSSGPRFGADMTFTTAPEPPVAATGAPSAVSPTGATLVGAVNPKGLPVEVIFEYGPTNLYGYATAVQNFPAGNSIINITQPITGLTADGTYHFRIIANSAAGTTDGGDVSFIAKATTVTGGGDPTAVPVVTTGGVSAITDQTAILQGTANPMGGPTVVYFQYGTTAAYGFNTATQSIGNGTIPVVVDLPAGNLPAGSTVHYRLVASNSLGASQGNDATFATKFAKPDVGTGEAVAISTTSVRVSGFARANRADATVIVEYGPDPSLLNRSVNASPFDISGDSFVPVEAEITDLAQGGTYYYRLSASNTGGTGKGILRSFNVGVLSGLLQEFPAEITSAERSGSVTLNLTPTGIGGGWRFSGEQQWRPPGSAATGLTTGDRIVEFRPVPGYLQPTDEAVAVDSGGLPVVLSRGYTASGATGSGELTVTILPAGIASGSVSSESRAQWRLFGESDAQWKDSGAVVSGLVPGDYVVESKPVVGRTTPGQIAARITDGQTTLATTTYFIAESTTGTPPAVLDFATVSAREDRPFAYVGQIRSDAGSSTGFVVRPRVVATAGHVVFDDGTLAATTGLQWLFQRDRGVHEPKPQIPRGYYLMTGYGAQRAADNSPGTSTPQSQNLDAAAIYFQENAGRGGFSGYLASDSLVNEFLTSSALKTLVGYPLDGVPTQDQGRMHATPLANIGFSPAFGRTYITADIRSRGGNSGGPLCVLNTDGAWYPAAIYLGGSNETVVRAIDSDVLNLFGFAEVSGNASAGSTGGGFTQTSNSPNGTPGLGSLRVLIEPAAARSAGGGWRIQAQAPYATSGARLDNLDPNTYTVQLATVTGFVPPSSQSVVIQGGQLRTVTFTYEEIIPPPFITSPPAVTVTRGQVLNYQITANNSPQFFFLQGVLPIGMDFNSTIGLITGTPQEAGQFIVNVGATNAGGSDTRQVTLTSLPVLVSQQATTSYQEPFDYQIVSSEVGSALTFTAGSLPAGLVLDSATGRITGSPTVPGVYAIPISVAKGGAASSATLTLTILGSPPVITLHPLASKTVEFGQSTTLTVAADGLPAPSIQWYQGISGNVANPVPGATSNTFVTPALSANTSYWARATSISGAANSSACAIQVVPSSNANLANLGLTAGDLTPGFNAGISNYAVLVPNAVTSISLTPVVQISQSIARVNGLPVVSGSASAPISLAVGSNAITIQVTAGNGTSVRTYSLAVTRGLAATVSTAAATAITDVAATLNGAVTPFSNATAFFQYGLTTSYGNTTPPQGVSGNASVPVAATLAGLTGSTEYHYRLAVSTSGGTVYGQDMTFTSNAAKPLVATGDPGNVTTTEATLIGAVNPRGLGAQVYLEYGPTTLYGSVTPVRNIVAGNTVVNVTEDISGLTPGNTYHCRIIATSAAGTSEGNDISFTAEDGGGSGGTGVVTALPVVTTGGIADLTTASASLQGTVNPKGGITFAYFEYGLTNAYGSKTEPENKGNGNQLADVTKGVSGLLPGTTYHYRLVASNSLGTRFGNDATFVSGYFPPIVATGSASALTSTSARVNGTVMARGASSEVYFDYGTNGTTFPNSVRAFQQFVNGEVETPVNVDLLNLDGAITYYYRVRAVSSGGEGLGLPKSMQVGALAGLAQDFTRDVPTDDRQGQVLVNLLPAGTGAWRFAGEQQWRQSGVTATGLTTGDREIEYQPVPGYYQPQTEIAAVVSGAPVLVIGRYYFEAADPGSAGIKVTLKPDTLTGSGLPAAARAQWRFFGSADTTWRDSGEEITGLTSGSYLIESKSIAGWSSPAVNTVNIEEGDTTNATITYFPATPPSLNPPVALPFSTVSTTRNLPYAYVGQVRTNSGSHSGFVVKPRVVATAAQAIFDEETLAVATGTQWLLQRDRGTYEPDPLVPRGFYVFDGYAAQRTLEATPGTLAVQSQNLNVGALYFTEDAGRGGFSGFLASDAADNEFLQSPDLKTLVGYPVNGIATANQGRMHGTPPATAAFALAHGRTYTSPVIRGVGGMTGGPLCVQYGGGSYFPAGVYVGGTTQGAVRSIDASVIGLFTRAETSANGGDNNTDGGYTQSNFTIAGSSSSDPGRIKVILKPDAANTLGAGWRLKPMTSYLESGDELAGKPADSYTLQLSQVPGYQIPPSIKVQIKGGEGTKITYTYLKDVPPPTITSTGAADGTRGTLLKYNITATPDPDLFTLQSGILPAGLTLGANSGQIYGTLGEAGVFVVRVKAANDGGADTLDLAITSYPNVANQTTSILLGQPMNYKIASSESGSEVTYTAASLPQGLFFNTSTGRLTGSPLVSGVFDLPVTVTKAGATSAAVLTLTVTATALDSWRLENLGTTSNTGDAANSADPDGDGKTNIEEYAARTLPRNAADFFRVTSTSRTGTTFTATFDGRAARTYVLERRTSLDAGPWTTVATVGPLATAASVSLPDPNSPEGPCFYRIRASAP